MTTRARVAALERARADDRAGRVVMFAPWEAPPAGAIRLEWGDGPVVFLPDNGRDDAPPAEAPKHDDARES